MQGGKIPVSLCVAMCYECIYFNQTLGAQCNSMASVVQKVRQNNCMGHSGLKSY